MAQDLTVNIKTTSDVPQAMNKAGAAASGFDKQLGDIGKKFSTAFKDIALGFIAPMVLLQGLISFISSSMAEAKKQAQEGLDLLAKGETTYATSEEKKMANFFKAKRAREEEQTSVETGKKEMTARFLRETTQGQAMLSDYQRQVNLATGSDAIVTAGQASGSKELQDAALKAFLESPEGKAYKPIFDDKNAEKAGTFKGPEGFGNVVGVGANPVMEKMTHQNELLEDIKNILWEQTQMNHGGQVPDPFTERVPLTMQKAGLS
jgi:hypothetical protein